MCVFLQIRSHAIVLDCGSLCEVNGLERAPFQSRVIKFGVFEVDLEAGELRKSGLRQKLAGQPFQVLQLLLERPQRVVTREQLQERIWPGNTFVDYDLALTKAINRIREVLGDSAESPRFIETIPRRGYRFIAPVNENRGATTIEAPPVVTRPETSRSLRIGASLGIGMAILLATVLGRGKFWQQFLGNASAPQIRSIAVLPLENLSGDPAQEYFSDGMTDALITNLAQIGSLRVISRTSSMQYKQTRKSLPEIARELNVDGIVEGTVQRSGDRVRITAQLIEGPFDRHLWANSYEEDTRDVFALEENITVDIARQVRARLPTPSQIPASQPRQVNPDALEAYLQGNYYLSKQGNGFDNDEALKKAQQYLQQAINADPSFAPAYSAMANAHTNLLQGSNKDWEITEGSAKKAIEIDPRYSDAHDTLGWLRLHRFWDWVGAEEEFRKAIAFNPSSAEGHQSMCALLGSLGRLDEALKECQVAQELDPNQDRLSEILYARREYDRAIEEQRRWISRYPDNGVEHHFLFHGYWQKGMHKEAIQELEWALILFGSKETAARIRQGLAISGYEGAIQALAREIEHMASTKEAFLPMLAAESYTLLGNNDRALYWLEQAYAHPELVSVDDGLMDLKSDPMLDPLRSDPRYKDLLRRVGLPP